MNIYGKSVILRAIEKEDFELIIEMFNNPEIEDLVVGWAFPVSRYSQEKWFEKHFNDQNNFRFIIETKENGSIGIATLTDIDWKNRNATYGIKIASEKNRGKGIGEDTVMAIMRYVFDELGLHRLDTSWLETNKVSSRLFKKCGWKVEGVKREYIYKKGQFINLTIAGILASDYYSLIERSNYWN